MPCALHYCVNRVYADIPLQLLYQTNAGGINRVSRKAAYVTLHANRPMSRMWPNFECGDRVVAKLSSIKIRESLLHAVVQRDTETWGNGEENPSIFLSFFVVIYCKIFDYLCLAVEINVILVNVRYPENVEYAVDVNLLALCGPSVWGDQAVTCFQLSSTSNLTILLLLLLLLLIIINWHKDST